MICDYCPLCKVLFLPLRCFSRNPCQFKFYWRSLMPHSIKCYLNIKVSRPHFTPEIQLFGPYLFYVHYAPIKAILSHITSALINNVLHPIKQARYLCTVDMVDFKDYLKRGYCSREAGDFVEGILGHLFNLKHWWKSLSKGNSFPTSKKFQISHLHWDFPITNCCILYNQSSKSLLIIIHLNVV